MFKRKADTQQEVKNTQAAHTLDNSQNTTAVYSSEARTSQTAQAKHSKKSEKIIRQGIDIDLAHLLQLRFPARQLDLGNYSKVQSVLHGNYLSSWRGRGMDFEEVRTYQPGDDIRSIDWRVTARTGKPHTKVYRVEKERPVIIAMDFHSGMFFGTKVAFKSIIASEIAALVGWAAMMQGDRIGALFCAGERQFAIRPRSRQQGMFNLLNGLVNYATPHDNPQSGLSDLMTRLRHVVKPGSLVFIISDFTHIDQTVKRHLNRLAKHNEVIACGVYDRLEIDPPTANRYKMSDGKDTLTIDTRQAQYCQAYKKQFLRQRSEVKHLCHQYRVPFLEFATDESVIDTLQEGLLHRSQQKAEVPDVE